MPVYTEQVKRPHQEYEYSIEEIKELKKCNDDFFHFLTYVKIIHPDYGRIVFDPYPFQKEMFQLLIDNRFCALLVARQMGKSLSVGAFALHYSIFNSDKVIGIVSNKESSAIDFLSRIKIMYEELPEWLKCGVVEYNKKSILFENGTLIVAGATSKNAFRGKTCNVIISDELAFIEPGVAEDFFMSNYPTISVSKTSKFIAISTPNGVGGLFYELYMGAKNGTNDFVHFKADWRAHPDRDEDWAKVQLRNIGRKRFDQEYDIKFIGSANTVLDKDTLLRLSSQNLVDPIVYSGKGRFRMYEKPKDGAQYVLGVDCAKGTGEHYSTIQVLRIDSIAPLKLEQVAVFEDNFTDTYEFAQIVVNTSYYYNGGYIMAENNGEGSAVISEIWWNHECEHLVCEGSKATKLGIRATTRTKPIAVLLMKKIIENESIIINDFKTIQQFLIFIDKGNNKFVGNGGPDDLVSALYWATYIFEMDILEDTKTFKENEDEFNDAWGDIFTDVGPEIEEGYSVVKWW